MSRLASAGTPRAARGSPAAGLLLAGGVLLAVACDAGPGQEMGPGVPALPRHELIFARHSDAARKDYDIWRMCGDGTQMASLVVLPGQQFQVSVSPDGNEFLYSSKQDGQRDIWRKPFRGGEAVNITRHPAEDSGPAWSPDGGRVAFFSDRDAQKPELYVLDLASGAVERLTDNAFHDSGASWAPDGKTIVFTRYLPKPEGGERSGDGEIIALNLETREETQLTRLGGYNGDASHSPDGRRIAFHRAAEGGVEIWLVEADGSNPRAITETHIDEYSPAWSPDGEWLAFTAGVNHDGIGTFDLWLMRPDGSRRQVLNKAGNTEAWHAWRPGEHRCR